MLAFIPVNAGILKKEGISLQKLPCFFHEVPLHYVMVGVWCATSATRNIGPVFPETTNSQTYVQLILTPFSEHLSDYKRNYVISSTTVQQLTK